MRHYRAQVEVFLAVDDSEPVNEKAIHHAIEKGTEDIDFLLVDFHPQVKAELRIGKLDPIEEHQLPLWVANAFEEAEDTLLMPEKP
jgi:hypothetical protein